MADLDLARIKRNVAKMAGMNAPEADIDGYIASEGATVDAVRAFRAGPAPASAAPSGGGIAPDDPRMEFIRRAKENVASGAAPSMAATPFGPRHMDFDPASVSPAAGAPSYGGVGMNLTAGPNEVIYQALGAPVDLMAGAMNLGIRGFNAATGSEAGMIDEPFGGSQSIGRGMGAIAAPLDPANTKANTVAERVARGVGQGVAGAVLPAGLVGGAARAGMIGPQAERMGAALLGRAGSGTDAALGAIGGAGGAVGQEIAPEGYGVLGSMAGGMLASTGAVAGMAAAGAGRNVLAPFTAAGRDRLAVQRIDEGASNPQALRDALDRPAAPLVPGSQPTTFQATGDLGVGSLERGAAVRAPDQFAQRRADQNTARTSALGRIETGGAPEKVAASVRQRLADIEAEGERMVEAATSEAQSRASAIGSPVAPEVAGGSMRGAIEAARAAAKERERALWSAVDPEGTMTLGLGNTRKSARDLVKDMSPLAAPMTDAERQIYTAIGGAGQVVPLRAMQDLQANLKAAMRAERMANGESPVFRRMSIVSSGIAKDFDEAVAGRVAQEAQAVAAGRMPPEQSLGARIEAIPKLGNSAFTASGKSVPVGYEVVDAATLRTSNGANGLPSADYPAELQPRDRSRAASDAQIARMAGDLQPERLGPSADASTGAPIVGPDGIVESGNGRVLAIRRAYGENGRSAQAYRDYLAGQGYDTAGMREPVLIRRRSGDMPMEERARFAQEANASSSMAMSAGEQAATDASRLKPETLRLYRGGDVTSAENRDFARAFLGSVTDRGQEGSFVTSAGSISIDGARRIRGALLHSAYEDGRLVSALIDEGDENIRAFGRSLDDLAGGVARLKAKVASGEVDQRADLSPPLVEAARIVQAARSRGVSLADAVSQQDAFNQASPAALLVLSSAYGPQLTGRLSRERLSAIMGEVVKEAEQQTAEARLFGEPLDIRSILAGAQRRYGNAAQPIVSGGPDRAGLASLRAGDGGLGRLPDGTRRAENGAGASRGGSPNVLEPLAPNFDGAARERLNAANAATRERVSIFDNGTLGPIRQRPATTAPYTMPAGVVPAQVFNASPKSFEAIAQLRGAIGDQPATEALQGYATGEVLRIAGRPDGTIDPAKLATWRRSHANALRALPELDAKLADAGKASAAIAEVAAARKAAVDAAQKGALGRLVGVDAPEDVTRIVGGIFSAQDAAQRMRTLRQAVGNDPEAAKGLRRAVVEHMSAKFIGNTEAGTSGLGTMKSDAFQTFVRQNGPALEAAGFSPDELRTLGAIAEDLQRANRSISAVKNPGGSDTAQNLYQIGKDGSPFSAAVRSFLAPGGIGLGVGVASGSATGLAAGAAAAAFSAMRNAGLRTVDDIVTDALLNPERARLLLSRVKPGEEAARWQALARNYGQIAARALTGDRDEERKDGRRSSLSREDAIMEALAGRSANQSKTSVAEALFAGRSIEQPDRQKRIAIAKALQGSARA